MLYKTVICAEVVSTVTGDSERGVGEMVRTYMTDTPPEEEESQSRVIMEELGWF